MWWQIFFVPFDYYCPLWLFLSHCKSWTTSLLHTAALTAVFCEYCKIFQSSCWTLLNKKSQIAQSLLLNPAGRETTDSPVLLLYIARWEVTDLVLACFLWLSQKKLKERVYFPLPLPGRIPSPRDLGPELKVGMWNQKLKKGWWRNAVHWFASWLAHFSRMTCPRVASPTVDQAHPHPSLIRRVVHSLACRQIW